MSEFVVLTQQDSEFAGSDSWWMRGRYETETPEDAVREAYADTYFTPNRRGLTRRTDRVAVTGPGHVWAEFTITLDTRPAVIVGVSQTDHGDVG